MPDATLLPPSSTATERAIDTMAGDRLAALPAVVSSLWNAATCPEKILPWLAWSMSVDEWDEHWSVDKKRSVIAESTYIHQHKGTPSAIRRAMSAIGQGDAIIVERGDYVFRNGTITRDGSHLRKGSGGWATYRIILAKPLTIDQARQIRRLLAAVQRNCITLTAIDFSEANNRRNGTIRRDGTWTRGVVNTTI